MARTSTRRGAALQRARTATRVVVQRAAPVARRGMSAAATAAREERHTLVAVGAAGLAGYARREGMLDNLPHFESIGVEATYGALAWVVARYTRSRIASHVATGLLCIAANRMGAGDGSST